MIIRPGPSGAVSFTDDTSPNLKREPERKVSIHAQVIRADLLGWYYTILSLYQDVAGELKSDRVLANFPNLPKTKQDHIWKGLKTVRINVVDTLPYQAPFTKTLKEITQRDDVVAMLKDRARRGDDFAKRTLKFMDESVTKMLVGGAPAKRFISMARFMRHPTWSLGWYVRMSDLYESRYIDSVFDMPMNSLDPAVFETRISSAVTKAVKWISKSSSVFFYAMDSLLEQYWPGDSFHYQYRLFRSLQPSHAFDGGDDQAVQWIDKSRQEVAQLLAPQVHLYLPKGLNPLYGNVSSEESYFTQAADIAAGFARQLYEREGIVALTHRFEYVTFNGLRISQTDAEEEMRKWRQMGYISRNDKAIYTS